MGLSTWWYSVPINNYTYYDYNPENTWSAVGSIGMIVHSEVHLKLLIFNFTSTTIAIV